MQTCKHFRSVVLTINAQDRKLAGPCGPLYTGHFVVKAFVMKAFDYISKAKHRNLQSKNCVEICIMLTVGVIKRGKQNEASLLLFCCCSA